MLLSSCSTLSGDWGEWKIVDVAQDKRQWKFCRAELHGDNYHHKGICYVSQECRYRRTIFRNVKSQCRNKMLFCPWGDVNCMVKYDLLDNIIIEKGE